MERNLLQELKVGLFVFGLLLVILACIYILGGQSKMFADEYRLHTAFTDVKGLKTGAVIRLAGIDVGQITEVDFSGDLDRKEIEVELTIRSEYQPRVRADSVATISQIGVLGDMYITLTVGTPTEAVLNDGDTIRSLEGADLMATAGSVASKFGLMLGTDEEAANAHISQSLAHVESLLADAKNGEGPIHMLLYDKEASERIKGILTNVEGVTADAQAVTHELRHGDSIAHALLYGDDGAQLTAKIGGVVDSVDGMMSDLRTKDSLAHALLYDPQRASMVDDLAKTLSDVQGVTDAVNAGDGTLGLLVRDPALYEDVRALMGGAQRNALLRAYVRATVAHNRSEHGTGWEPPTDQPSKNGQ